MSALTVGPGPGHGQDWDDLLRIWEETDAPEGCKVEIISRSSWIWTPGRSPSAESQARGRR
jgi:hypothetical protein